MTKHTRNRKHRSNAFSLLELLAVMTIMAVLVAVIVPSIAFHGQYAKRRVCRQYKADLNSALERYFAETGTWPNDLDELVDTYYPDEIPKCPADNSTYTMDASTHRISGHDH